MIKDNPNDLAVYAYTYPYCPVTKSEIDEIAKGVLVRARIRPVERSSTESFHLFLHLKCAEPNDSPRTLVYFSIDFVSSSNGSIYRSGLFDRGWHMGTADAQTIKSWVRESVEDVVADYLKANFDLGDDE